MTERQPAPCTPAHRVYLQGKVHAAHPSRTVRRHTDGQVVPIPACGQRSKRFLPSALDHAAEITCRKCLEAPR